MSKCGREKLSIVFRLDCQQPAGQIQVGTNGISRSVVEAGISDVRAMQLIVSCMRNLGMEMEFRENGRRVSAETYLRQVERDQKWSRTVSAGGLSFGIARVPALNHCLISIEDTDGSRMSSWANWIGPFLSEEGFVQGWVSDVEYEYWQNAKDPLEYEAVGRSYNHLPMKSNGLPPPLEQLEIDTSNNPGRRSLRSGYVDAVGSVMWLGRAFWQSVGERRKEVLLSSPLFDTEILRDDCVQVTAVGHRFCDESNRDLQDGLRTILFG